MFLVFSLQRLCRKSVQERKQIDNKAEKGYLKFCLDRQREIFEIFYWQCMWGYECVGNAGNKLYSHIPFIASKTFCLGLCRTPKRGQCLLSLFQNLSEHLSVCWLTDHIFLAICLCLWFWLSAEDIDYEISKPFPLTCLKIKWQCTFPITKSNEIWFVLMLKKKQTQGQRDNATGMVFVLHKVYQGLIPGIPCDPLNTTKSDSWVQSLE